jgi:anti-anti-sigma factor
MTPLTLRTTQSDEAVIFSLAGELDLRGATVLDPALERVSATPGPSLVVLDLREVEFLDSSGLRSVLMADSALRATGRSLALVRGPAAVHRVFAVTRMDERLHFLDHPSDAGEVPRA